MRILIVHEFYYPQVGGVELVLTQLAEGLAARGHHVKVITSWLKGTPHTEQIHNVEIERIGGIFLSNRYLFSLLAIGTTLRQAKDYHVLHTSAYNGAIPAFIAARLTRKPIVFTVPEILGKRWHLVESNPFKALGYRLFEHVIAKFPYDRIVAISQATLRDLLSIGVNSDRACYMYLGIENDLNAMTFEKNTLRKKIGANDKEFLYVYFGRPGITKGVEILLEAASLIKKRIPSAHLVLILATQPETNYRNILTKIRSERDETKITLLPPFTHRHDLFEALSGADCIVIPSLTEGFGLATAEACALNVPVVATKAGAIPEVVSGKHILVEPGSIDSLASGIEKAARGEYNWSPKKHFSWDSMVDGYEALYRELI